MLSLEIFSAMQSLLLILLTDLSSIFPYITSTAISMLGRYKVIHKDIPCNNRLLACLCYLVLLNLCLLLTVWWNFQSLSATHTEYHYNVGEKGI